METNLEKTFGFDLEDRGKNDLLQEGFTGLSVKTSRQQASGGTVLSEESVGVDFRFLFSVSVFVFSEREEKKGRKAMTGRTSTVNLSINELLKKVDDASMTLERENDGLDLLTVSAHEEESKVLGREGSKHRSQFEVAHVFEAELWVART